MKDFFISYNKADKAWAEWIAWILEEAEYTVVFAEWDFRAGENFVLKMHEAAGETKQTIAIISDNYLNAEYTHPEWAAAFARNPKGEKRILIPIKVRPCEPDGLLGQIIHIDLIGLSEEAARAAVLSGLKERAKPDTAPVFPRPDGTDEDVNRVAQHRVDFPGKTKDGVSESLIGEVPSNLPVGIPLFIGRTQILDQLQKTLAPGQMQAISGLGGIGKTQTAVEYAHRFRGQYTALLWAVAESTESLRSDFVAIAGILNLPEANLQDQTSAVNAVKKWLTINERWLLILDNADDLNLITDFIPRGFKGSILLTSRAQVFDSLGILNPLELQSMSASEAIEFLMRRTGSSDLDKSELQAAEKLAEELDYLPLALEQAAAYIKELKGSFPDFLNSYRRRGLELLEKRHASSTYGKSVRTTWSLNFQQVAESSTASADFLRVSAFLGPDRIPTEIFTEGARELGPDIKSALEDVEADPLALDEVMRPPVNFSLIHRDRKTRTYNVHRLVQAVVMDAMDESTKILWATRVTNSLERIFLNVDERASQSDWVRIELLVPHVQRISDLHASSLPLNTTQAVRLFNRAGRYLHLRGRLPESQKLYDEALSIADRASSDTDLDLASSLHNRAWLYHDLGEYGKAEPLFLRAVEIREKVLGPFHADVALSLHWLGVVYEEQGRYNDARRILQRALAIWVHCETHHYAHVADTLRGLAILHYIFGEFSEALALMEKSIELLERGSEDTQHHLAPALQSLGLIEIALQKFQEAETSFRRSIEIYKKIFGSDYPRLAFPFNSLARIYIRQNNYDAAEDLLERSLKIREAAFGSGHPEVAVSIRDLAYLKMFQRKYSDAEFLINRALSLIEETYGPNHPEVADVLMTFISILFAQKLYWKAEPLSRRVLSIRKTSFGLENRNTVIALETCAQALRGMNRKGEAQRLDAQARKIQAKLNKKRNDASSTLDIANLFNDSIAN